jgi:Kef-type K+ transport system membrane component KefB
MLSHFGLSLLLFIVGLNLSLKTIKEFGKHSLILGFAQILITFIFGLFILVFGFGTKNSVLVSICLAFSSTAVVLKLLYDKKLIDTLSGKITTGILIVQDLIVVFVLIIFSNSFSNPILVVEKILIGIGFIFVIFVLSSLLMKKIFNLFSRNMELLILISIAWCFVISVFSMMLGFSIEIGALLSGISLSNLPQRYEIEHKIEVLRDFFIILFFILVGSQINISYFFENLFLVLILSLFVLIIKPIIIFLIMLHYGYPVKTSFYTSIFLSQISEFSFVIASLFSNQEILSLITLVGLITITISSYFIYHIETIYLNLLKYLEIFKKFEKSKYIKEPKKKKYDVILFGFDDIGIDLLETLKNMKLRTLVIDLNPEVFEKLVKKGIDCILEDVCDLQLLDKINFENVKMSIITIQDPEISKFLINKLEEKNNQMIVISVAQNVEEAKELYNLGSTYVLVPHLLGGAHAAALIEKMVLI